MGCFSSKDLSTGGGNDNQPSWDGHIRATRQWKLELSLSTEHLKRLRTEFWETRVEGRPEMWQALQFVVEAETEELCDETIKAAGLRPANRKCTLQSMFDEKGALYELPMYVLSEPSDLDEQPVYEEFKDAARAVAEYIHAHERPRRSRHHHI